MVQFTNSTHLVSELLQSAVSESELSLHKDLAGLASSFCLDFFNGNCDTLLCLGAEKIFHLVTDRTSLTKRSFKQITL